MRDLGVSELVCGKYREFGAVGVGGRILDGDVPFILGKLHAEAVSELEVREHGSGADGVGGVDEVEVQDAVVSLGATFLVFIADLIEQGSFAARRSCGEQEGILVWVCHGCGSRLRGGGSG